MLTDDLPQRIAYALQEALVGGQHLAEQVAESLDLEPGDYLSLCVIDTGSGIAPEFLSRIFDPFFTTKPVREGTGLGLSMIYGFAEQSGGWIKVDSTLGEGTTMCLYMPRRNEHAPSGDCPGETAAEPETKGRGEVVLVVEDEPVLQMLTTEILGDLGYTTLEASGSAGGLEILNSDGRIDLLIMDVGLPGLMNGRQLAKAAREVRPEPKVFFVTGFADTASQDEGQLRTDIEVLTKPYSVDAFAARVDRLLGG
ncbi:MULTISPECIES: ATP-binding protein [Pseudomonas]|uniref:ATP-binding protein n=1 Tax=Pseudomonas TaxID=286 RepID=UPI0009437059|nr:MULTISPECIES: ATP-binding protein [Pseudomonas]HJE69620.1 response regulator [Pseudomonas oryzihabitans]